MDETGFRMSRQLTVLQILPALESGGVERGTLEVAGELVRRGYRSIVVSGGGRLVEELERQGSEHITMPVGKKSIRTLGQIRRLRGVLRERHVDIVHVRSRVPGWLTMLTLRGMRPGERPHVVTTCHGLYSVNRYSAVMTRGERVIVISDTVRDHVLTNFPATDPSKIRLVYRGVDPDLYHMGYQPNEDWKAQFFGEFPQLAGRRMLTLPGRLTRVKGHANFIELMDRLRHEVPDVIGLVVGGEDPKRQRYAQEIYDDVRRRGLDNLVFAGHRSDLRDILAVSDLAFSVSTSPPEAFGRTTLEALAIGTPVVGFDGSGTGEILAELFPAGSVPHGDMDALTSRTLELLSDCPAVRPNETFTLQRMLGQTLDVYTEVVGPAAGKVRRAA